MNERLLTVDEAPRDGRRFRCIRYGSWHDYKPLTDDVADAIAAELDRLYAAAEANQAPGPDWKATADDLLYRAWWRDAWHATLPGSADPGPTLTPDPDAPPVYVPPEGHVAPVLGADVRDGWEGRFLNGGGEFQWSAGHCRANPTTLFEVRRVPAPEPATEWVPLHELRRGMTVAGASAPIHDWGTALGMPGEFEWWPEGGERLSAPLHVRDDGMVEVLAEGER